MSKEIIVEAGAAGGSLTLYAVRNGRDWLYSSHVTESYSEDDGPAMVVPPSKVVKTWNAALKLLDDYRRGDYWPCSTLSACCKGAARQSCDGTENGCHESELLGLVP